MFTTVTIKPYFTTVTIKPYFTIVTIKPYFTTVTISTGTQRWLMMHNLSFSLSLSLSLSSLPIAFGDLNPQLRKERKRNPHPPKFTKQLVVYNESTKSPSI
jgi:hypothetical protein